MYFSVWVRCRPECGYKEIGHLPFLDEPDWPCLPRSDIDKLRIQLGSEGDEEGFLIWPTPKCIHSVDCFQNLTDMLEMTSHLGLLEK